MHARLRKSIPKPDVSPKPLLEIVQKAGLKRVLQNPLHMSTRRSLETLTAMVVEVAA